VAIIHLGKLRGVGAVEELTAGVGAQVEVVWAGTIVPAGIRAVGAECHVAGDTVRSVFAADKQDAVLEMLRRERLRLISVTPVRMSLEDYFITQLGDLGEMNLLPRAEGATREGSADKSGVNVSTSVKTGATPYSSAGKS
jgi:hypothetical protein